LKALSIKQPWASLIVNGHKDIENRDWPTNLTGPVLIHAGKRFDEDYAYKDDSGWCCNPEYYWLPDKVYKAHYHYDSEWRGDVSDGKIDVPHISDVEDLRGGIVGIAEIVACTDKHNSPWFVGKYGFVLRNARPLPFTPLRGQLKFFDVPDEVIRHLNLEVATK
jgi:hypothetical protein